MRQVGEVRAWVQQRAGHPCRRPDGAIDLNLPGEPCRGVDVEWGEFEPNFCVGRSALVYDDAPGSSLWFLGGSEEVRSFLAEAEAATGEHAPGSWPHALLEAASGGSSLGLPPRRT
jgi:hypothetical protein